MMPGIPVVIAANGYGAPVKSVAGNAPVMTVATNGYGIPIVLSDRGVPFVVEGAAGPSADLQQYNARLTTPLAGATANAYQTFFAALRNGAASSSDIIALTDQLHILAGPDSQAARQNLVSSSYPLSTVNSPAFTAFSGFQGDGASAHLTSPINYSLGNTLGTQNDMQLDALFAQGGWVSGQSTVVSGGNGSSVYVASAATSQGYQAWGNNFSAPTPGSVPLWDKLVSSSRPNSTQQQPLFDGAVNGSAVPDASLAPSSAQWRLLRSGASVYSPVKIRVHRSGRRLTAAQTLDFRNAIAALFTSLGVS